MKACKYELKDNEGVIHEFNSEAELDDFFMDKKDTFLNNPKFSDIVFSRSAKSLRARNIILEQKSKAEDLEEVFFKARQNAINIDSEVVLNPDPPYIGVTKFLDGRRNSEGNLLTPQFIDTNFWDDRISHWTSPIPANKTIQDMFSLSEIRLLAEGDTDDERYQNFLNKRSEGGTYKPLSETEANNLKEAISKKWDIVNTEGTAIHFVMQMYFSELTDSKGNPIIVDGKILHTFDLRDTPSNGFPSIQDYIMNKVKTELPKQMRRKYRDDLITPALLNQLINYGESLNNYIKKIIPGEVDYFPELKITGDLHNVSEGPQKLMGILDLVVLDKNGVPHIFDYKCSDKKYSEFSSAKKRGFYYQQAIYNRLLRQHGLNTNSTKINILPITLDGFKCTTIDQVLVDPKNIQFTYSGIYYPLDNPAINIKPDIFNIGPDGSSRIIDNIDEFLPEEKIVDASSDESISFVTKMMSKFFPDYSFEQTDDMIKKEIEDADGFKKQDDGLYHFRISTNKEITSSDPAELLKKVIDKRKQQQARKSQLAQTTIEALQYAQEHNTRDIQEIVKNIDTRWLEDSEGYQGWFKNFLQKYCNSDWQIVPSEAGRQFGIILLRNTITNQLDVIKTSASNLKYIRNIKGNKNTIITRAFQDDVEEKANNNSRILKDAEGNRELIETMLFLNTIPSIFSGQYNGAIVGNIQVINPFKGQGLAASNEELLYCYNKLTKYAKILGQDNIANGNVKFAKKWQLFKNELNYILNNSSNFNLSHQEYFQGCEDEMSKMIMGGNNDQKVKCLLRVIKGLEDFYNIKQLSANQLNSETIESPAYRLYYNALITLGELRGLRFNQQLKESAKWLEGGVINAIKNGISGIYVDNPGNLASETLNSITALHTQALQNVRHDMSQIVAKIRTLTDKLKKEKNFGYITSFIKNDISLYANMYKMQDGDLRFKNINDSSLSPTEKEYLHYALQLINKNRFPNYTQEQLNIMENSDNIQYYRVPLCRATQIDMRDAVIKEKRGESGELEKYDVSLWQSFKNMLKTFIHPAEKIKAMYEKVDGVFNNDNDTLQNSDQLYQISTMFDANEPDSAGNNLQDRLDNIASRGTGYFEQNLETLLLKHSYAYATKNRINEIMPTIKAGMAFLINMGNTQNTNFKNDIEYYENYIKNKIKGQPLMDDPILGNSKASHTTKAVTMTIRSAASFMALAFNPVQWVYQRLNGIFNSISLIIRKPDGTNAFTFKNMFSAYKEVNKDLFHYSDKPTKCQLINELYGINDMDMNQYAEKLKTDTHGIFNLNDFAFKFTSRPDYYNRMTIIIAQLKEQGVWDALEVKDNKLVYDWKKDKRFSVYANNDTSNPEYYKQKALYLAIANQFVIEETQNPDGSMFEVGQPLPTAYTNKEMESMKSLCDMIYGYYNNEKKSMIHSTFLGGLYMQMKTYWSGKKNQYMNPGGVRIMGHWEQIKDQDGNNLFYQTDENGKIDTSLAPVPASQLNNKAMQIPYVQWKGQWQEGIVQTVINIAHGVIDNKNPLTWISNYNKFMENLDPNMRVTYRQNIKQLVSDFVAVMLISVFLGGLLADKDKELIKEAKESGAMSDAVYASLGNIISKSVVNAASDFNGWSTLIDPLQQWTPFAFTSMANFVHRAFNCFVGDNSAYENLTNTFSCTKIMKPVMESLAPDGGYILPHDEA